MTSSLKKKIMNNTFIDQIRTHMRIDESAYGRLCSDLVELAKLWRGLTYIDKELALILYSMPLMVRNAYLSFHEQGPSKPDIVSRLEDIWTELDMLVIDCFSDSFKEGESSYRGGTPKEHHKKPN